MMPLQMSNNRSVCILSMLTCWSSYCTKLACLNNNNYCTKEQLQWMVVVPSSITLEYPKVYCCCIVTEGNTNTFGLHKYTQHFPCRSDRIRNALQQHPCLTHAILMRFSWMLRLTSRWVNWWLQQEIPRSGLNWSRPWCRIRKTQSYNPRKECSGMSNSLSLGFNTNEIKIRNKEKLWFISKLDSFEE